MSYKDLKIEIDENDYKEFNKIANEIMELIKTKKKSFVELQHILGCVSSKINEAVRKKRDAINATIIE